MWFNFKKLDYDTLIEAIEIVKKEEPVEDYVGSIYVGQLEIALFLKGSLTNGSIIKYEVNIGGIDTGYGYTTDGNEPYDFGGEGILINNMNAILFEPFENFKKQTIKALKNFIEHSDYDYDGITLLDKANDKTPFNWN